MQGSESKRSLVDTVTNLRFPYKAGSFLTSWVSVTFSKRVLLHGVIKLFKYRHGPFSIRGPSFSYPCLWGFSFKEEIVLKHDVFASLRRLAALHSLLSYCADGIELSGGTGSFIWELRDFKMGPTTFRIVSERYRARWWEDRNVCDDHQFNTECRGTRKKR
jgi:hypothetical protein